jgi:hypothetical protein
VGKREGLGIDKRGGQGLGKRGRERVKRPENGKGRDNWVVCSLMDRFRQDTSLFMEIVYRLDRLSVY